MGAFDPLFRGRRRSFGRRTGPGMVMGAGRLGGLLGIAGIGYAAYRFLQTERGRAVQTNVVEQVRNFGERMRARSESIGNRDSLSRPGGESADAQM